MKKLVSIVVLLVICFSCMSAFAYTKNGAVIGHACYTDIRARINGYDIASYNVDGYTYIIAEDLRNYGFDVVWDASKRALYVNKELSESADFDVISTYKTPFIPNKMVGQKSFDLLYTDIRTYVRGKKVQSYNIDGRTIFRFEELSTFGEIKWDSNLKTISIDIPFLSQKYVYVEKLSVKNQFLARTAEIEANYTNFLQTAITQMELNFGSREIYEQWDKLLNDVYAYLRDTMPSSEFASLKADEKEWAIMKDAAADAEYKSWQGGSMAPLQANSVLIHETEARCYYLISLIDIYSK